VYVFIGRGGIMEDRDTDRRKRDTSAKRKSILNAAVKVFLSEGFENASMDRISEAAAASKRTVYNHFPRKEDLLRSVIELFEEEMRQLKDIPYDNSRTIDEQLGEFIDVEVSVAQNPTWMGLIRLLLSVFTTYPDLAKEAMARHARSENGLISWMRAAFLDGKLATDDYILASRVFSAMLGGAFTWPAVYQGGILDQMTPDFKQEIIRTFLSRYGTAGNA